MTRNADDVVTVAVGTLTQVEVWRDVLRDAGIDGRVVGGHLTAGLGTALPGSAELWVHRADATAAEAAIAGAHPHPRQEPESHPTPPHGHPGSDPKPDRSRGPQHGAPPHRPLPS
jgi:hypothetical protein